MLTFKPALGAAEFSAGAKGYHKAPSDEKGVPSAPTWREASSSPTLRALETLTVRLVFTEALACYTS